MKRILSLIIVLILIAGILTACGSSSAGSSGEQSEKSAKAAATTVNSGFPLTVTDDAGSKITLQSKPQDIISLTLGTDEMLLKLVDKSRIKALTYLADDKGLSNIVEEAKAISNKLQGDNAESVIALQPDLVIVADYTKKEFVQQLLDAKLTVYKVRTPNTIDEVKRVVNNLAQLTGEKAKGTELNSWIDEKLKAVSDKLSALKPEQKLGIMDYSEMGSTSGKGTNFDDIVTRAGLVNVAAKAGLEGWPQLSKEKIVTFDPDLIMVPSWTYDKNNSTDKIIAKIKGDKALAALKAIKNNRIITSIYAHMSSVSQNMALAVEDVAKAAYPDLFK